MNGIKERHGHNGHNDGNTNGDNESDVIGWKRERGSEERTCAKACDIAEGTRDRKSVV